MELNQVIKKPLITERSMADTAVNKYTFVVDTKADKNLVKKAVEEFFKVNVKKVWISKIFGKKRKVGRKMAKMIQKPDWKKAIVKLAKDQKIELFDVSGK